MSVSILKNLLYLLEKDIKDIDYLDYINPYFLTDLSTLLNKYKYSDNILEDKLEAISKEMFEM